MQFTNAFGEFSLDCPQDKKNSLIPWNQADAYLLSELAKIDLNNKKVGIVNDTYGALSVSLANLAPVIFNDSATFLHWLTINSAGNESNDIHFVSDIEKNKIDVLLVKLPKSLSFYRYILSLAAQLSGITVIVAGMQKHMTKNHYEIPEQYFESIKVLPGVKKAKCLLLKSPKQVTIDTGYSSYNYEGSNITLASFANVFSGKKLDIGTRFFLDNFPSIPENAKVLDLCCGNGALGIQALKKQADAKVCFLDESWLALEACRTSLELNGLENADLHLVHSNGFHNISETFDIILCNPPFHFGHIVSEHIAEDLIARCNHHLTQGGAFYLIGNRHLAYPVFLKRYFNQVTIEASNEKFVLLRASESKG